MIRVDNSILSVGAGLAARPLAIFALRCFIDLAEILLSTSFAILLLVGRCAIEVVDEKNFELWELLLIVPLAPACD